jgi:hypothetical protein
VELKRDRHSYVFGFIDMHHEAEIIDFSGLHMKKPYEILKAMNECTDIVVQTAFVNGSENQFDDMAKMMASIKEQKNVHIALLGTRLIDFFDLWVDDDTLLSIRQHNIFELGYDGEEEAIPVGDRIKKLLDKQEADSTYRVEAKMRLTGRLIKIIACNGLGRAFSGLPIGDTVPELDMSQQEPNGNRGVWVWGNGERIKLVNDSGIQEYEVMTVNTQSILDEIMRTCGVDTSNMNPLLIAGLITTIEDSEDKHEAANFICSSLNIPKRFNRQYIYSMLRKDARPG